MIAGILLAGGKSDRMGAPKALLPFRGQTFLQHILAAVQQSRLDSVCVVVGRHRTEIENAMSAADHGRLIPEIVFNADYEKGMITSIQAGIRALPEYAAAAVLLLVDHPLVQARTIDKLIDDFRPGSIIVPVYAGRRGHPVLFSRAALQEILDLEPERGANTVLRRDPRRVLEVPVDDRGVICDIDTPEDFAALLRENSL